MNSKYKYLLFLLIITTIFIFNLEPVFSEKDIVILPKTGRRKPAITFDHKSHIKNYGAKCIDCHHKGENKKCSACHLNRDQGNIIKLKGAFHQQCRNCHRVKGGPRGCGRCHIKNKLKSK